jgi:glycosyltransferase involved in cell wall biosynthesis
MPTYNTAHLIGRALDSILQQTFQDFEIIVVNDGSPDTPQLEQVLAPYLEKIVYIKQPNKRAAGARNTAIRQAKGEFLAFLDSDDYWLPNHLAAQMKHFADDPSLDFVYCNGMVETEDSSYAFMDMCPSNGQATFEALVVERCQVAVSTVVVRKRAIEKANLFDESLPRCDDYDMWLRTAFWGAKIAYTTDVQAHFSGARPGALSGSRVNMVEAYWKILENARQSLPLSDAQNDLVARRAAEIRAQYLLEQGKVQLHQGKLHEAMESLAESNQYFRRTKLNLLLLGLKIAPSATYRMVGLAGKMRGKIPS